MKKLVPILNVVGGIVLVLALGWFGVQKFVLAPVPATQTSAQASQACEARGGHMITKTGTGSAVVGGGVPLAACSIPE